MKTKPFFKSHILPVLFIFLIPGFSAWFFSFAENRMDREILHSVERSVSSNYKLENAEKERILAFYRRVPVSRIMASRKPDAAKVQAMFEPAKIRYAIFRWMKRISWICLGTVLATLVIVGTSVWFSMKSQSAQYYALRIAWPVLRTAAAIQVLGQAALAVALSFWVTAILTESYYVKLIVGMAILALGAVAALMKAIFSKVTDKFQVEGELITESDAPSLWHRVREIAAKLDTRPPERIIAGVAPSFFVTENPVEHGNAVYQGRTLFLSLPMLKVLSVEEADAVLGHELAHFSGQDTFWTHKISPLRGKFQLYLNALGTGGMAVIVAHFMHLFWKLYNLSLSRLSREREFRADQLGADQVSKEAMKRALVKVTAYCEYRAETDKAILEQRRLDSELNLALKLEQGYPAFLASFTTGSKAFHDEVPHPFDSHPPLHSRLAELGFDAGASIADQEIQGIAESSWFHHIATAPAIEEQLWTKQQEALQAFHGLDLAWRLLPEGEEEEKLVLAHFPHAVFHNKKGEEATLAFDRIQLAEWEAPILFKDITELKLEDAWPKKRLTISHLKPGQKKSEKTKFYPGLFTTDKGDLLASFTLYYSRHKTALARQAEEKPKGAEVQAVEGDPCG